MTKAKLEIGTSCHGCGMLLTSVREYHPFAVCELYKATRDAKRVRANIRSVIEYGMRAERAGISAEDAMRDLTLSLGLPTPTETA